MPEESNTPCANNDKCCNVNVHNILNCMLEGQHNAGFVGGLFNKPQYPIFEGCDCRQYLQEYVPFHLPQIEYVLTYVLRKIAEPISSPKVMNILDIGSGPATVPLAFCRLPAGLLNKFKLNITTLEVSAEFNRMIQVFKAQNTCSSVSIVENIHEDFETFANHAGEGGGKYNWIIIANFISGIGQERSNQEVNIVLNNLMSKIHDTSGHIYLTIIEGNLATYFNVQEYLAELENMGFQDFAVERVVSCYQGQRKMDHITNCMFYKTKYGKDSPYINTKTLLLRRK